MRTATLLRAVISRKINAPNALGFAVTSPAANAILGVTGSGTCVIEFTLTNPVAPGSTVQLSYNQVTGDIVDTLPLLFTQELVNAVNFPVYNPAAGGGGGGTLTGGANIGLEGENVLLGNNAGVLEFYGISNGEGTTVVRDNVNKVLRINADAPVPQVVLLTGNIFS
jgi:hypothetical protein